VVKVVNFEPLANRKLSKLSSSSLNASGFTQVPYCAQNNVLRSSSSSKAEKWPCDLYSVSAKLNPTKTKMNK
jgi:hypothetical protein